MRLNIWLLILIFIALQKNANAQEYFSKPPAKLLTKFNFKLLSGGVIVLNAKIDHYKDTLNFIFDTGSGGISLDSLTADLLGLPTVKTERTIRGIGGIKQVNFAYKRSLILPGLTVDSLDFHINNYDLLTSAYGIKVDGIIGFSVLKRYIVTLNYDDSTIAFYTPGLFKYPKGGYLISPYFTTLPFSDVVVKDEKVTNSKFIFDTGAGLCMLFSEDFIEDSSFLNKKKKIFTTYGEGIGGKKAMQLTVIKEVKLGPFKFKRVPVFIFNDEYNVTSYPSGKGVIGNDLLRRFNVILNYQEQSIYIKPNTHFNSGFDYSYTGLELYLIDGEVTVDQVIPGSPAEKAGFKSQDVILAINTTFSNDLQLFKNMLQDTGNPLKVLVARDKEIIMLHLAVKDIR